MISKQNEEMAYLRVLRGELKIDGTGEIWKIKQWHFDIWRKKLVLSECSYKRVGESIGSNGYCYVYFSMDGKYYRAFVHRLVWRHFNGAIPPGLTINHKDGNKQNNHPMNLELATYSDQMKHSYRVLGNKPACLWGSGRIAFNWKGQKRDSFGRLVKQGAPVSQ